MINKVILIGNVGKDAENIEAGESTITKFSVATESSWKDKSGEWQNETTWHNVIMFKASKTIQELEKGNQVYVEGSIKNGSYENKEGNKVYTSEVKAQVCRKLTKSEVEDTPF